MVHGMTRFAEDGSVTIYPSEQWKTFRYDAEIQPFPNSLGKQVDNVYRYSLDEMRGVAFSGFVTPESTERVLRRTLDLLFLWLSLFKYCRA